MQSSTRVFFELLADDAKASAKHIAQQVRHNLPGALSAQLSAEDHKSLEAVLHQELKSVVWRFLTHFDNKGCHLPSGILGYTINAHIQGAELERPLDIRIGEQDYSDSWSEFSEAGA